MTYPASTRVFLLVFLSASILWMVSRLVWVRRQSGKNPVISKNRDPIHDFNNVVFRITSFFVIAAILIAALLPAWERFLLPIPGLGTLFSPCLGQALMVLGWVLMVTAQLQMGTSWRIGIDKDQKTTLIAKGLYRFSRNPIYVGMMVILLGILMVLANAVALGAFLVSLVSVPIQVRLEETYLRAMHGEAFEGYCGAVRRWL